MRYALYLGVARTRRPRSGQHASAGASTTAIKDALIALWEASDRVCGKRLVVMIPTLLLALERHGRLRLGEIERTLVLSVSAATIDRLLGDVKVAAAGGRRRRVGFYSAIRREVPIRTFNDWNDRRLASARSTWWRTVAPRSRALSFKH